MHVHILGICGTLMGSIALLARELGHTVTGTDENVYPPMSTQLEEAGISLTSPYSADNVPKEADLVIVGNAGLPRGNPAIEAVLERGMDYTSGAEWLSRYLLKDRWVIAIAGTHGKTTTASMTSWILEYAGLSPGFMIGGIPLNFNQSSRLGEAPFFVIEADEYDTSYFDRRAKFLHYRPRTLVLNNLEYDHADIYPDLEAIKYQFHLLLRSIPGNGLVIHPQNDDNLIDVITRGCWTPRLPIGSSELLAMASDDGSSLSVCIDGEAVGNISWSLTGEHNVMNALSAIAAARHAGVPVDVACEALDEFKGVKRRMEKIYSGASTQIYDDFAHHPTAIRSTLEGLRDKVGNEKIVVAIEPASHTMRNGTHAEKLSACTTAADRTFWYQPENLGFDMSSLVNESTTLSRDIDSLIEELTQTVSNTSDPVHLVIMSNGAFGDLHQRLTEVIADRDSP